MSSTAGSLNAPRRNPMDFSMMLSAEPVLAAAIPPTSPGTAVALDNGSNVPSAPATTLQPIAAAAMSIYFSMLNSESVPAAAALRHIATPRLTTDIMGAAAVDNGSNVPATPAPMANQAKTSGCSAISGTSSAAAVGKRKRTPLPSSASPKPQESDGETSSGSKDQGTSTTTKSSSGRARIPFDASLPENKEWLKKLARLGLKQGEFPKTIPTPEGKATAPEGYPPRDGLPVRGFLLYEILRRAGPLELDELFSLCAAWMNRDSRKTYEDGNGGKKSTTDYSTCRSTLSRTTCIKNSRKDGKGLWDIATPAENAQDEVEAAKKGAAKKPRERKGKKIDRDATKEEDVPAEEPAAKKKASRKRKIEDVDPDAAENEGAPTEKLARLQ